MQAKGLALAAVLAAHSPASSATVEVVVSGVAPGHGNVQVALCVSALEPERCQKTQTAAPSGASVHVAFADVAPGRYAIAAFQDEDGTGVLRRGKLGIPLEPFGFSNGAGLARRPKFDAAAFDVSEGVRVVSVKLKQFDHRSAPEE
jgi:uncharacterized protein (DUF2141 family)